MYTIDASVWVNGFDRREPGHVTSRHLLELVRTRGLPIIEPMLVLAEVAGAISRTRQDPARAQAFASTLGRLPNVTVVPSRLTDIVKVQTPEDALADLRPPPEEASTSAS